MCFDLYRLVTRQWSGVSHRESEERVCGETEREDRGERDTHRETERQRDRDRERVSE